MQCKEIIQVIEATFPRTAALGFDNVGLLAGRSEKEVSRIYLALDATDVVIDRAIKEGADMLIRIMMCLVWQNCPERSWIFRMGKC